MFEDVKTFNIFENVLSKTDFEIIDQYNKLPTWQISKKNFLYTDLSNIEFFSKYCVHLIDEMTKTKHSLYRCYRNGIFPISEGVFHYDTHERGDVTFLMYGHQEWNLDWGGETIFDDENRNFHYIKPTPNAGVYFSSKHWKHQGRPFTMNAKDVVRISYVWKLKRV